jgi:hypothetical protein
MRPWESCARRIGGGRLGRVWVAGRRERERIPYGGNVLRRRESRGAAPGSSVSLWTLNRPPRPLRWRPAPEREGCSEPPRPNQSSASGNFRGSFRRRRIFPCDGECTIRHSSCHFVTTHNHLRSHSFSPSPRSSARIDVKDDATRAPPILDRRSTNPNEAPHFFEGPMNQSWSGRAPGLVQQDGDVGRGAVGAPAPPGPEAAPPPKRGRGRPPGSRNKKPA